MKTIGKFMQSGITFDVKVRKTESQSNYNLFCCVFKHGDKQALTGRTFKDTDTKERIMKWGSASLGRPESDDFKRLILDKIPKTAEERYPELDNIAFIIANKTSALINELAKTVHSDNPYKAQCILEMVITKLEKAV